MLDCYKYSFFCPRSNLSNETFKDIVQKETAVNFLSENEFKTILPDLKKL